MRIYFDMDGTLADLYGVEDWLPQLRSEKVEPYLKAQPLVNAQDFADTVRALQNAGYTFGIISWGSKGGSNEYTRAVAKAKKEWLKRQFDVDFDEIHIVKYGTPKHRIAKQDGWIFDDDYKVLNAWNKGQCFNPEQWDIVEVLKSLL